MKSLMTHKIRLCVKQICQAQPTTTTTLFFVQKYKSWIVCPKIAGKLVVVSLAAVFLLGALRDIQKTAARETKLVVARRGKTST